MIAELKRIMLIDRMLSWNFILDLPTLVTPFAGLFSFAIYELKTMLSGDSTLIMYPKISSISLVDSFT